MAETQVNVHAAGEVVARVGQALGIALPVEPTTVATAGERSVLWLGPDEWLVVDTQSTPEEIEATVRAAFAPDWGSVVDVSANRSVIELSGPQARDLLARGCSLDLHPRSFAPGRCAQTLLASTAVILWQTDDTPTCKILVRASCAAHLTRWLADAATP
jgi:sarcosine oxidase subunit gamma